MKRQRGFTTAEMMVSGGIMLAVTFLTFDVMLTNTKLSAQSVQATAQESEARTGLDLLQQDILAADATLIDLKDVGSYSAKDDKMLILRLPVIASNGNIDPGKKRFVVYTDKDKNNKKCLVRLSGIQVGNAPFTLNETDVIATDVKDFKYRLARSTAITPVNGNYPLPSNVTDSDPSGSKIRILSVSIPDSSISATNDPADTSKRGLSLSVLNAAKISLTGTTLSITVGPPPTKPADVLYEIDETYSPNVDKTTIANQIRFFVKIKGRKGQPDTNFSASGLMRNAK